MSVFLRSDRGRLSRHRARKLERRIAFSALGAVMVLSFFVLIAQLSNKEDFLIQAVRFEGNALTSTALLSKHAEDVLSGAYLAVFPKRNTLLFKKRALQASLLASFPALESVSVGRSAFSELTVAVHERTPVVLYCKEQSDAQTCSFVDENGLIFSKAPDFSSDVYLRFEDKRNSTLQIGEHVFSPERFREFSFFIDSLKGAGLSPISVSIEDGAAGFFDYAIELDRGAQLYASSAHPLEKTLSNIVAFFADPTIAQQKEHFLSTVSYVDFRFENKAYYKLRGE